MNIEKNLRMVTLQVIEEHDQNYDKKLNILEYRGFLEEEVRGDNMRLWFWILSLTIFSEVEEELREKEADQTLTERDHQELQRLRDFLNSDQWL